DPITSLGRRGLLPETLFATDLPAALGVASESAALRIVKREGIPHGRIGRRIVVRREAFLAWLASRETVTQANPPPAPAAPEWARLLLRRGRRPGLPVREARRTCARCGKRVPDSEVGGSEYAPMTGRGPVVCRSCADGPGPERGAK